MREMLERFCRIIQHEYGSPDNISPEGLAQEFISHSGLSSTPSFAELHALLLRYGVGEITPADLSAGKLKGHHFSYQGADYTVLYDRDLWQGSIEHVMLHDLYEIIVETCEKICRDYKAPPIPRVCSPANRFSAATLMQTGIFQTALLESGLNLVEMHHRFQKSYSSVAIRAVEVLNEMNVSLPADQRIDMLAAIYERFEGNPEEWGDSNPDLFVIKYSPRTSGIRTSNNSRHKTTSSQDCDPDYSLCYPWHLIPRRHDGVADNSLAFKVIQTGKCHHVKRVSGFDLLGYNDLTCVAQPVWWFGNLAKIIVVGVRLKDRERLASQVDKLCPVIIEESYQVI